MIACDLDPRAVDQAARSLAAAGLGAARDLRRGPLEALAADELAGAVLMANLPAAAHRALLRRIGAPPAAAVLSGLRPAEAGRLPAPISPSACARPGGRSAVASAAW